MPRSRTRSRSQRRDDKGKDGNKNDKKDDKRDDPPRKEGVAEAAKSGSSEQEIVSVAIRQLPADIRERLEKLFEEGLLKEGDLDLRSITVFASLNEGLQARVMNHMENERIYVANARSKSGFLIATCDKAKTGCLDARGLGAIDPWRTALVAMATPKQKMIDLKPERDWLEKFDEGAVIKINVNVACVEKELGMASVTVELPLTETSAAVKAKLVAMGVKSLSANKMKLHTEPVGFLKEYHTFAYYNLEEGVTLTLSERKRGGVRFRADHTTMPKRPRTQPQPGAEGAAAATASPVDALQKLVAGGPAPGAAGGKPLALPKLGVGVGLGGTAPSPAGTLPATGALPGLPSMGLPFSAPGAAGSAPGAAGVLPGTAPGGLGSLLGGIRPGGLAPPSGAGGLALPGAGGLALPGAGTAPGAAGTAPSLGALGGLSLPKLGMDAKAAMPALLSLSSPAGLDGKAAMGDDLAKAKAGLLPDSKAPSTGLMQGQPMSFLAAPGMSTPGMMAGPGGGPKAVSMPGPLSVPGGGGMTKAQSPGGMPGGLGMTGLPGGVPGMPGGGLLPGMGMPGMELLPKAQSKSQMPTGTGPPGLPKLGGGLLPPGPGFGAPSANEAVAAATAKAAPS